MYFFVLEVQVGTRCTSGLMDHVIQKNSSDVVLGDLKPNQSYLVTPLHRWKVGKRQTVGVYPIREVSVLCYTTF